MVAAGTSFTNAGSGFARGVDALVLHRGGRLGLGASYGYLDTWRTNPLNTLHPKTYRPQQAQTHTFGASADYSLGSWVFALKYLFHVGRPYTPISSFSLEGHEGQTVWVPQLAAGELNADRLVESRRPSSVPP